MLTIKLDLERGDEDYKELMKFLTEGNYDIAYLSWDSDVKPSSPPRSGQTGEGLGKGLSAAIDHVRGA